MAPVRPTADESSPAVGEPWPGMTCPVCGDANGCVPAASGRFDLPCWCTDARFAPGLIARVRAQGARACICAACAAASAETEVPSTGGAG